MDRQHSPEMLDHVIPLNERHLRRLSLEYLAYYHDDRTYIGLNKAKPTRRPIELRPTDTNRIQSRPRIDGLHHRYYWAEAV